MNDLQATLYEADQILKRAKRITESAPFWMSAADSEFAQVAIDGETAVLSWPEAQSGYYDSCSVEAQSVKFPTKLLLMSMDEIGVWQIEERKKYDAEQAEKKARLLVERAREQTALELSTLAKLKAKYEPTV